MILFEPRVRTGLWTKKHYDILILLQQEAIQEKPALLQMILDIGKWRVKRMDIAFDWLIPISQHFIWKNGNVRKNTFPDNQNYNLYGERSENRAILYDKKEQLRNKKNIETPDEYLTRLEIRLRPKLNNQSVNTTTLDWLKKYLNKFIYVENAGKLSRALKEHDKKAFRALRRNSKMNWNNHGGDSAKRRIRAKAKEHSVDLFDLFISAGLGKDAMWITSADNIPIQRP